MKMELSQACQTGDVDKVIQILSASSSNINDLVGSHRIRHTALHLAAQHGHLNIIKELLVYGADVNIKSSSGRVPLHEACVGGFPDIVKYLVEIMEDVNCPDSQSQTPAHISAYQGETECLEALLMHGGNVTVKDNRGRTCLDLAVMSDHVKTFSLILQKKTELALNLDGYTFVQYACQFGAINCLQCCYKNKVDLLCSDDRGMLPIHVAAKHGKLSVVEFLLKTGQSLYDTDTNDRTVVHFAVMSGSVECVHWMLEQKFDVSLCDSDGNSLAHCANMGQVSGQILNCLHQHGADIHLVNKDGDTPLQLARKRGCPVLYDKAVTGVIRCDLCVLKKERVLYEEAHQPSNAMLNLNAQQSTLYASDCVGKQSNRNIGNKTKFLPKEGKRNMANRYYGNEIFHLPKGVVDKK